MARPQSRHAAGDINGAAGVIHQCIGSEPHVLDN